MPTPRIRSLTAGGSASTWSYRRHSRPLSAVLPPTLRWQLRPWPAVRSRDAPGRFDDSRVSADFRAGPSMEDHRDPSMEDHRDTVWIRTEETSRSPATLEQHPTATESTRRWNSRGWP